MPEQKNIEWNALLAAGFIEYRRDMSSIGLKGRTTAAKRSVFGRGTLSCG